MFTSPLRAYRIGLLTLGGSHAAAKSRYLAEAGHEISASAPAEPAAPKRTPAHPACSYDASTVFRSGRPATSRFGDQSGRGFRVAVARRPSPLEPRSCCAVPQSILNLCGRATTARSVRLRRRYVGSNRACARQSRRPLVDHSRDVRPFVRSSSPLGSCLQVCFYEPEVLVDCPRDFREEVGGVLVTQVGCLVDRGADRTAVGC